VDPDPDPDADPRIHASDYNGSYPDPDPAICVMVLQEANKKLTLFLKFFSLLLFEDAFTSFFKDKKSKKVTKQ
jgi:hypothetical protein